MIRRPGLLMCVVAAGIAATYSCVHAEDHVPDKAVGAKDPRPEYDFGFIATRDRTPSGEYRVRFLGPLYESRELPGGGTLTGWRPFASRTIEPARERTSWDILWPIINCRTVGNQRSWRALNAMGTDFDIHDPESRWRFWFLPFLFAGRDIKGEKYAGLFPVAGDIREVVTMDSTKFILFPLLSVSERAGVRTRNILYPLISASEGPGLRRFRFFPFYGRAVSEGAMSRGSHIWLNPEGISEARGRMERTFIMWPIWTHVKIQRRTRQGFGYVLFPIYGRSVTDDLKSWTVLPPFIRWTTSKAGTEVAVWPFVGWSRGSKKQFYVWPFMGVKSEPGIRSSYVAWPFLHHFRRTKPDEVTDRFVFMPFVHRQVRKDLGQEGGEGETIDKDLKLWPVASYHRRGDRSKLRIPDLWPVMNIDQVENNYAPLWTLYSRERAGNAFESEILWGLYRHKKNDTGRSVSIFPLVSWRRSRENTHMHEWSLLRGLLGYERDAAGRRLRFLYLFRLGLASSGRNAGSGRADR